jgi:hypothetical protein
LGPEMEGDGEALGRGTEREGDGVTCGEAVRPGVGVALGAGLTRWTARDAGVAGLVAPAPLSTPPASTPPMTAAAATTTAEQFRTIRLRLRRSPSTITSGAGFGRAAAAA